MFKRGILFAFAFAFLISFAGATQVTSSYSDGALLGCGSYCACYDGSSSNPWPDSFSLNSAVWYDVKGYSCKNVYSGLTTEVKQYMYADPLDTKKGKVWNVIVTNKPSNKPDSCELLTDKIKRGSYDNDDRICGTNALETNEACCQSIKDPIICGQTWQFDKSTQGAVRTINGLNDPDNGHGIATRCVWESRDYLGSVDIISGTIRTKQGCFGTSVSNWWNRVGGATPGMYLGIPKESYTEAKYFDRDCKASEICSGVGVFEKDKSVLIEGKKLDLSNKDSIRRIAEAILDIRDDQQFKDFVVCKYPSDFSCAENCKVDFPLPNIGLDLTPIGKENPACNQDTGSKGSGELNLEFGIGDGLEMGAPPDDPEKKKEWDKKFLALVLSKAMKQINEEVKEITKNSKCNSGCSPSISVNPRFDEMKITNTYIDIPFVGKKQTGAKVKLPYDYTVSCSGVKNVNSWKIDASMHAEKICMEKDKEGS